MTQDDHSQAKKGVLLAISAYTMWGIAPIYFKAIQHVSELEILAHRVIWSVVFLALLIFASRGWKKVIKVLKDKRSLIYMLATSVLIAANWLVFIWAVNNDYMLDASLGYYINPLFNVLLGMVFLGERLRKAQWFAVVLAGCGVLVQLFVFGSVPIIALILAASFGFYGLLRKKVKLDAQTGLFIETLLLLPVAFVYLFLIAETATSDLSLNHWQLNLLLLSAGVVTTLPLLCFTGAATKLQLSTLGFFQYIGPSLMFILAVTIYQEAFTTDKAITFAFIWSALLVFVADGLSHNRKTKKAMTAPIQTD